MFIVIELQTNEAGQVANLVYSYNNINEAENKYHLILAAAAVSNLAKHSAIILTDEGYPLQHHCYIHRTQSELVEE